MVVAVTKGAPWIARSRAKCGQVAWAVYRWRDGRNEHGWGGFFEHARDRIIGCDGFGTDGKGHNTSGIGYARYVTGVGVDEGGCGWHVGSGCVVGGRGGSGYASVGCAIGVSRLILLYSPHPFFSSPRCQFPTVSLFDRRV
jgi:hypothetical protein